MTLPPVNPRWLAGRQKLQARFEEVHRVRDASQFAYLRGPQRVFTENDVRDMWAEVAANPKPGTAEPLNHVYLHVPFCKSICEFCNYERLKPSDPQLIEGWKTRVLQSIATIGPAVESLTFHSLYIGGGTPVILPAAVLDEVLTALFATLRFAKISERHIELDPAVVSDSRLDVLEKHGFMRYSFGIQTLDAGVNALHNRGPQGTEIVERCFTALHDRGFHSVSCDFLIGLYGTTPEQILADIAYVLEHHCPAEVHVFTLVPTESYVDKLFGGDIQSYRRHLAHFEDKVPKALPGLCKRFGYQLELGGHCITLTRGRWPGVRVLRGKFNAWRRSRASGDRTARRFRPFLRTAFLRVASLTGLVAGVEKLSYTQLVGEQGRPLNLLGFGTSARSQIFQKAAFQYRDPDDNPGAEGEAFYEGHVMSAETEFRTYLVHQLRDRGAVRHDEFQAIFGQSLYDAVGVPLAVWSAMGLADVNDERVELAEQDVLTRARTLLWLVPDPMLEYEIGRIEGLNLSQEGVQELFTEIPIGTKLAPDYRYAGVEGARVLLKGVHHNIIRMRVAPALERGRPVRMVVETPLPPEEVASVTAAVKILRAVATRHTNI